jgi:hypothetical protein
VDVEGSAQSGHPVKRQALVSLDSGIPAQPGAGQKPPDPFTAGECYVSYCEAGFAPHEVLYLVGQMLATAIRPPRSGEL